MMALLIPGPKSPGKDFDVFMQPLIRDLQTLWEGVPTRDVCQPKEQNFLLRAVVLYCTYDYPALGTMSGRVTSRYVPDIETRFNRGRRILEVGGSVFNHGVELIGKRTEKTLEQSEFEQLSWYVLNNATEADEYVK